MSTLVAAKVAGCYVPKFILRALATAFPNVKLVWNYHYKRWVLIHKDAEGEWYPFRMLGTNRTYEAPTMDNTVKFVARLQRIRTKLDRQQYLAELDATAPTVDIEKQANESIHQGNREMVRHVLQPRTIVTPWATRSPHPN